MRTVMFLAAGLLLMGAALILGKLFSNYIPGAARGSAVAFIVVWLAFAALNMGIGVAKAGYSLAEELPIFAVIFAVPAVAAWLIQWRLM